MVSIAMRALVSRPREESESLSAALATRGIDAVIEPLMEVHYRTQAIFDLGGVKAVLCTSANGVRALARASKERGVPIFAVGDATALRARAEGFTAVESAGGDVNDLVRLTAERLRPQDGALLHIAGEAVAGDLVGALRARGFMIERSILYEARPVVMLSQTTVRALRAGAVGFALFFSPRTAAVFASLAGSACVAECCGTITALSISAAADAALSDLPWLERHIAERPNQPALLDMLDHVLGRRSRG